MDALRYVVYFKNNSYAIIKIWNKVKIDNKYGGGYYSTGKFYFDSKMILTYKEGDNEHLIVDNYPIPLLYKQDIERMFPLPSKYNYDGSRKWNKTLFEKHYHEYKRTILEMLRTTNNIYIHEDIVLSDKFVNIYLGKDINSKIKKGVYLTNHYTLSKIYKQIPDIKVIDEVPIIINKEIYTNIKNHKYQEIRTLITKTSHNEQ